MNTKTCKKCGWVIPATSQKRVCIVCGEPYTEGPCVLCGEFSDDLRQGKYCTQCFNKHIGTPRQQQRRKREYERYDKIYTDWLAKVKTLPVQGNTLTEEQWLEACRHFGGCAYCGNESIDARAYFIPFKDGGRYCNWNIIPACERCAAASESKQPDPFKRYINCNKKDTIQRIVNYLEEKLNAAVSRTTADTKRDDHKDGHD